MHRNALDDTGVVYQDVDIADLSVDFLHKFLYSNLVCNVANIALHVLDASLLVVGKATLKSSLVDVVEDDGLCTSSHKRFSNVETNAIRGTCNPGILAFE